MIERIKEILEYFWIKIIASIPLCFLVLEDREYEMLYGFFVIVIVDTVLGSMVAIKQGKFDYGLLGKKLAKKFILYSSSLIISFVVARLYSTLGWNFYFLGSVFLLSEFGSAMKKLQVLGLKLPIEYIELINESIKNQMKIIVKNSGKAKDK